MRPPILHFCPLLGSDASRNGPLFERPKELVERIVAAQLFSYGAVALGRAISSFSSFQKVLFRRKSETCCN
jgi:hypothetical protein